MKFNHISPLFFFSFLFLFTACEKDININVQKEEPKVVVHSINQTDKPFTVRVGRSANVLSEINYDDYYVSNAKVFLYRNNILQDSFDYNPSSRTYSPHNGTIAETNAIYKLTATVPGMKPAEATNSLKSDFPVFAESKLIRNAKEIDGMKMDEVKVKFNDPVGTNNYYHINILYPYTYTGQVVNYTNIYCMYTNDADIENPEADIMFSNCLGPFLYMRDKYFNGKQKELSIYIDNNALQNAQDQSTGRIYRPIVVFTNVTEDQYKYQLSIDKYALARDNPFAEPVSIYSNIQNGFGIFAIQKQVTDTIR